MSEPKLPDWVYELITAMEVRNDEHPPLFYYDGADTYPVTSCGCEMLDLVPGEVRRDAELLSGRPAIAEVFVGGRGKDGETHDPEAVFLSLEHATRWADKHAVALEETAPGVWTGRIPICDDGEVVVRRLPIGRVHA
jgi:hypothetical protein